MDQNYTRNDERIRLLSSAAPLVQAFPGNIWLVHLIIKLDNGKIDKPPAPGYRTNDPTTWVSLEDAIDEALRYPPGDAGVGFTIPARMISYDFDNCIAPDGTVAPEIATLVARLDSFQYRTVSGRGIRVVCRNKAADGVPPRKYVKRTEGGYKVEVFVGPCNFYNTFSATEANGQRIKRRTNMTCAMLDEWLGPGGGGGAGGATGDNLGEFGRTSDLGKKARDQDALFNALMFLPSDLVDREQWVGVGLAFYAGCEGSEAGREVWLARSVAWLGPDGDQEPHLLEAEAIWDSFAKAPPHTIGAGTVFDLAKKHGWKWPEEKMELDQEEGAEETEVETALPETEVMPPRLSEAALARRFAKRHRKHLRYVAKWGHWYWWTGTVWEEDTTEQVLDEARIFLQEMAVECVKASQARSLTKVSTARAMLAYAAATQALAATVEQWDADPWLLNTPGGVADLRTGQLRPHRATDYMTNITAVAPDQTCPCPRWLRFLGEIMAKDASLIDYLQRSCGYGLTGDISEHVLCFAHGPGANGKSTFVELLLWLMGGYAADAPMETFTASKNDSHPTELARLQGARLVTASETEEGRHWAENRIKKLTGGDRITARFMRQDFFTFKPQFKLFIIGNHKPRLRNVDAAIRRRFHLIPFTVQIPKAQQDKKLLEKLQAEGPGILAWMVGGALLWQQRGLTPPKAVAAATEDYLSTEDALGSWLAECCETGKGLSASTTKLYSSYARWIHQAGEHPPSQRRFVQELTSRGFTKQEWTDHSKPKAIDGLQLKETDEQPEDDDEL